MITMDKVKNIRSKKPYTLFSILCFLGAAGMQYVLVELSMLGLDQLFQLPAWRLLTGWLVYIFLDTVMVLILGRPALAVSISAVLSMVLSIGNYYVSQLHGVPFTFLMLKNAGTALNVLSSYNLTIPGRVINIAVLSLLQIPAAILIFGWKKWGRKWSLIPAAALAVLMYFGFVSPDSWVPKDVVSWSWTEGIESYGYSNVLVRATVCSASSTVKPEPYDEQALVQLTEEYQGTPGNGSRPDVILILNETFYDLAQITRVDADRDYLPVISGLENCIRGYGVVPAVGGGTNKSEYELLTGNSLYVAPNITPFVSFDMSGKNSVVTYLKAQGYNTMAIHSEPAENYNRAVAYEAMGFDIRHFQEDFEGLETYYGHHFATDETVYGNALPWYQDMGEAPRLQYILTIQNHGDYTFLTDEQMLVHAARDFGEEQQRVNEFLTCISLADQSFGRLTEYLQQLDRDVIVCMVGDHAPFFAKNIADSDIPQEELEIRLRSTPYVIWSNHIDLSGAELPERMSLPFLVPSVMELAGLPLSGYYEFLLELRDQVPVATAYGSYLNADGTMGRYDTLTGGPVSSFLGFSYANINGKNFMNDFTRP